ncbi:MAG TPA: hypothetical protein VJ302_17065 [Blastocatellia bacterium]|nr:hypothetical protein [Blastocatellia bacterium]
MENGETPNLSIAHGTNAAAAPIKAATILLPRYLLSGHCLFAAIFNVAKGFVA